MSAKPDRARYLVPDEFRKLLAAAKGGITPSLRYRNHMLLCLAGNLGLRVGEVVRLRVSSFDFEQSTRPFVRVDTLKRRRRQQNDIALDLGLARTVRRYLVLVGKRAHEKHVTLDQKRGELCLFPGAKNAFTPMSVRAAQNVFKETAAFAGLDALVSFHALRHFRGCQIYAETKDLVAVKKFLRHKSISSSGIYVHMGDEEEIKINNRVGAII